MNIQEIRNILGRNVKYFRFHRQLSQADLAEKANISITFLSNIERGKMFPKVETLSRITESLNVDVFELFKPDNAPIDNKKTVNRFSKDLRDNINSTISEVFKQYFN